MKGDFPADFFSETETFCNNCITIEQQQFSGANAPILRAIDTRGKLTDGKLNNTYSTIHRTFRELQFKKLVLNSVKDVYG